MGTDDLNRPRRVVVVLGMHRSGTSAVAGCLHRLGVDFGPRLMPATEDNPRGYYEHIDLVNLHDRLLLALNRSWDDVHPFPPDGWKDDPSLARFRQDAVGILRRDFATAPLWGLKDPRLCRLLSWWEPLWQEMNCAPLFLLVRRVPAEVAISLMKRGGFSPSKSHLLWLQHTLDAERRTRGYPRALIDFKAFVADWQGTLTQACKALGDPWVVPALTADGSTATDFVDPALVRSATADNPAALPAWVKEADEAFFAGLSGDEQRLRAEFDRISGLLSVADSLYAPARGEAGNDLRHQLEDSRRQAQWYESEWQKARARADDARAKLAARTSRAADKG